MPPTTRFISMNSLRRRGWTRKLVATLLGAPIKRARNPYFLNGSPMFCFSFDKALEMESDPRFQLFQIQRDRRREAAQSRMQSKGANI
jgi:hypothetical protein